MANSKTTLKLTTAAALALFAMASPAFTTSAFAADMTDAAHSMTAEKTASFVRFNKTLSGDVTVFERDGRTVFRFSESFRASRGPDLKIFLSPQSLDTVSGATATDGAVRLGELKSNRGVQEYVLPEGVKLSEFSSVLVHCEQFSVLWGGAELL